MVSVAIVRLIGPLAGHVVHPVVRAAVRLPAQPAVPVVVLLVPLLFVWVVPLSAPHLVGVAPVAEFAVPRPLAPVYTAGGEKRRQPVYHLFIKVNCLSSHPQGE